MPGKPRPAKQAELTICVNHATSIGLGMGTGTGIWIGLANAYNLWNSPKEEMAAGQSPNEPRLNGPVQN